MAVGGADCTYFWSPLCRVESWFMASIVMDQVNQKRAEVSEDPKSFAVNLSSTANEVRDKQMGKHGGR